MSALLQKQDQQMDNVTDQVTIQNQILSAMTTLLAKQDQQLEAMVAGIHALSKSQYIQTEILTNMASSLQNMSER